MTYDRLKAKVIPGEHCRFCGNDSVPLVKTKCCELNLGLCRPDKVDLNLLFKKPGVINWWELPLRGLLEQGESPDQEYRILNVQPSD